MPILSVELQGHACYLEKTIVGPFSPGLNVIAGEKSSGKTSILTAVQCAIDMDGDHPPNHHESPAGKADKVSVIISFDRDAALKIVGDPGGQLTDLKMSVSRDSKKQHLWESAELDTRSERIMRVSSLMRRPNPYIWLLPQGMIASLLDDHDSDLWGIFKEYVRESKEQSSMLRQVQTVEGYLKDIANEIAMQNERLEVLEEYKEEEETMMRSHREKARRVAQKSKARITEEVLKLQNDLLVMQQRLKLVDEQENACKSYLQCLSNDYSLALKKCMEVEGKQSLIKEKSNSEQTKEHLEVALKFKNAEIAHENGEIKLLNTRINDGIGADQGKVMRHLPTKLGDWDVSHPDQVDEHGGFTQYLRSSKTTIEDEITLKSAQDEDLRSGAKEPNQFTSTTELECINADSSNSWSDAFGKIVDKGKTFATECDEYCNRRCQIEALALPEKVTKKQKMDDLIDQQIPHDVASKEYEGIRRAIIDGPATSDLHPYEISSFYTNNHAHHKDKSEKLFREAKIFTMEAEKRELEDQIWLLDASTGEMSRCREALELAKKKVLDYEASHVARCTLDLGKVYERCVKSDVEDLSQMEHECEPEPTYATDIPGVFTVCHGELKASLSRLEAFKEHYQLSLDGLRGYTNHLEFEALEELPQKFSEVFTSLVDGGTGDLFLGEDAAGSCFHVKVKFGEEVKLMSECTAMEKTVVVLSMILAIHLHEKNGRICLLDDIDADLNEQYRKALWKWIRDQSDRKQFIVTVDRRHPGDIGVKIDELFTVTREGGKSTVGNQNLAVGTRKSA